MQVSQLAELDSHAVIGGSAPQEFFMSSSAEFFTILSSTLYRDKKLAVVREVVCNAHDAHVMGNCLDKPIEITISDTELTIKDVGPGIADDRMHPVYCGYGVSTKVDDVTQIGGFGLGCKAPFAYSDHFTVTSCHESLRSVYAISRGGIDSKGKPALVRMVKVPTEDTGITVSIPLLSRADRVEFERLIHQVVRNGGMNATLNGVKLPIHDFTGIEKTGYGLVYDSRLTESEVYVRLGAVLYPLSTDNPELTALVKSFSNTANMKLILFARPGEVGITPSREALSYSEQTVTFLIERLTKIRNRLLHNMPLALKQEAERVVKEKKNPVVVARLNYSVASYPFTTDPQQIALNVFRTAMAAGSYGGQSLSQFRNGAGRVSKAMFKVAMHQHRDYRRFFRRVRNSKVARQMKERFGYPSDNEWYADSGNLLIRMANRLDIMKYVNRWGYSSNRGTHKIMPIMKNVSAFPCKPMIILVRSREQAAGYSPMRGTIDGLAFIIVRTLKPEKIQEIRDAAKRYKFELVELDISKPAPKPKKVKVEPEKMSFYTLAGVSDYSYKPSLNSSSEMVDHAPVFIDAQTLNADYEFRYTPRELVKHKTRILAAYPKVALAIGVAQKKALIAAGSKLIQHAYRDDLLAIKDTPENLFILCCAKGDLFVDPVSKQGSATSLANKLAQTDLRFARMLIGKPATSTPKEEQIFKIIQLYCSEICDSEYKTSNHYHELKKAASKVQIKKADFTYLEPLAAIYGHGRNEKPIRWSDDLCAILQFAQRRHAAKQKPQLIKEAA